MMRVVCCRLGMLLLMWKVILLLWGWVLKGVLNLVLCELKWVVSVVWLVRVCGGVGWKVCGLMFRVVWLLVLMCRCSVCLLLKLCKRLLVVLCVGWFWVLVLKVRLGV